MKRLLIGVAALALATGTAAHAQMVSAPGGWPWFEVSPDGMEIEEATAASGTPQIIIKADQPTGDAKELQSGGPVAAEPKMQFSLAVAASFPPTVSADLRLTLLPIRKHT